MTIWTFLKKLSALEFCLVIMLAGTYGCFRSSDSSHRHKADTFSKERKYDQAIQAYWDHINQRLAVENRPEWENPYLYLLDIGDIYLEREMVDEAIKHYKMAEEKGVKQPYVNDRYRYIARWYEERGELEAALEHLKKYQERDPLLFGLMLDRIAKKIVQQEQEAEENGQSSSSAAEQQDTAKQQ